MGNKTAAGELLVLRGIYGTLSLNSPIGETLAAIKSEFRAAGALPLLALTPLAGRTPYPRGLGLKPLRP